MAERGTPHEREVARLKLEQLDAKRQSRPMSPEMERVLNSPRVQAAMRDFEEELRKLDELMRRGVGVAAENLQRFVDGEPLTADDILTVDDSAYGPTEEEETKDLVYRVRR